MNIIAYLKPVCGWSGGVREVFERYNLKYEEKLINEGENYAEMVTKSGQALSPCVEVNDKMLTDVSGEEVEDYLLKENLVEKRLSREEISCERSKKI